MGELPFTSDQFLQVFSTYNQAIWPSQLIAYLMGTGALVLILKKGGSTSDHVNRILGVFWLWMGAVYHILFFSEINPAAYLFGSLFILQGVAFIVLNRTRAKFQYEFRRDMYSMTGLVFILYAMIIYPVLSHTFGHVYPETPMFGVAPCPTTIFTFGLLLQAKGIVPVWLMIIPGLWSLLGFSAAYQLTVYEDTGLVIAGITAVILLVYRNRKKVTPQDRPQTVSHKQTEL